MTNTYNKDSIHYTPEDNGLQINNSNSVGKLFCLIEDNMLDMTKAIPVSSCLRHFFFKQSHSFLDVMENRAVETVYTRDKFASIGDLTSWTSKLEETFCRGEGTCQPLQDFP